MKKTYNINLSGMGFVIDDDAYRTLDSYLSTLERVCESQGQQEIAADIEHRVCEIFCESGFAVPSGRIISREDVEVVIGRIGSPEEIMDIETEPVSGEEIPPVPPVTPPPAATPPPFAAFARKRLYRDVDHKVLGGVCSGLAWYLGIDVVWVRIIMVVLAFLSASTMVLIYIVLWIVIPPARSPYERMQMMGMDPSVKNVGKVVTGAYDQAAPSAGMQPDCRASYSTTASGIGKVIVMILIILGLVVVGSLLLAMSVAFIGCLIAICVVPGFKEDVIQGRLIMGCVMGGCLVAGIPLFLAFKGLLGSLTERSFLPIRGAQWLLLLLPWLLGVAACITCGILLGQF